VKVKRDTKIFRMEENSKYGREVGRIRSDRRKWLWLVTGLVIILLTLKTVGAGSIYVKGVDVNITQLHDGDTRYYYNSTQHATRGQYSLNLISEGQNLTTDSLSGAAVPTPKGGYRPKFTIEELYKRRFEHRISNDIYMDPCKAG